MGEVSTGFPRTLENHENEKHGETNMEHENLPKVKILSRSVMESHQFVVLKN